VAGKQKTLRVGLIRCDKRALWYGAIFDGIDPVAYFELDPAQYHHMTCCHPAELTNKRAEGFKLVKVYDPDRKAAERLAAAFNGRPEVCAELGEVSNGVDLVFIDNESGDGDDHARLAKPGLEKGVPTFIDRPLASTVKDAQSLIRLARRRKTVLLSCSHMRLLPHLLRFRNRFAELEPVERGVIHGFGPNPAEAADSVEIAQALFAEEFGGRVTRVQSMGRWPLEVMLMTYADRRRGRVLQALLANTHCAGARHAFHVSVQSNFKPIYLDDVDRFLQSEGGLAVMDAIKESIRTQRPVISYDDMLATVAALEAGRASYQGRRRTSSRRGSK